MRKAFLFSLFLCIRHGLLSAQVSIQPMLPATGIIQKNHFWNVLVVNSASSAYTCRLELALRDRQTGFEIMTATSGVFNIEQGTRQLNEALVQPVQYNNLSNGIDNKLQGFIAVGSYMACYSLIAISLKEERIAEECIPIEVEPLSPPMLIAPQDSADLEVSPKQFSWLKPTPDGMFENLGYDIIITEISEGQKPEEAIQQNIPVYSTTNLQASFLNYSSSYNAFEKEKWYAWQVVARDNKSYAGKSETWVFKIRSEPEIERIIKMTPYVKMKKQNAEKTVAPNGIFKFSYLNQLTDSSAVLTITDLSESGNDVNTAVRKQIAISPGLNLIQTDVKQFVKPAPGHVYMAQLINSKSEAWFVIFEIKNYKN